MFLFIIAKTKNTDFYGPQAGRVLIQIFKKILIYFIKIKVCSSFIVEIWQAYWFLTYPSWITFCIAVWLWKSARMVEMVDCPQPQHSISNPQNKICVHWFGGGGYFDILFKEMALFRGVMVTFLFTPHEITHVPYKRFPSVAGLPNLCTVIDG